MKKKILALLVTGGMILSLAGCGKAAAPVVAEEAAATEAVAEEDGEEMAADTAMETITIGYACKDINDTFMNYLIDEANAYAEANNITLDIVDAQNDVVKQQDQVNNFITQKVDALIVLPIDTSACAPITQAAVDAGIPLIYLNTNPYPNGDFPEGTYYCGSIEREAGELQAEYIGGLLDGKGKICILQGALTHEGAIQRTEGVKEKLAELYPDIEVLAEQPAEWQKDLGMNVTQNWLTAYDKDIDAIFANNDEMALGAINALQELKKTDTLVIGIDGTVDAIKAIEEGKMAGSVLQDAKGQAVGAMELAMNAANGETISENVKWVPFQLITPENVKDFME